MNILSALIAGLLFGLGLILAGMSNPNKVLSFLDITGQWDPSLALVMLSAIAVAFLPFQWIKSRKLSLLKQEVNLPNQSQLDRRLLTGAALFGLGWGISGICPGPALVLVGTGHQQGILFALSMLAGMAVFEWLNQKR